MRPRVCLNATVPALVVPAPHRSFRAPIRHSGPPSRHSGEGRNPEGWGWGNVVRAACPPLGWRRGVADSAVAFRRTKPQLQLFIPWCAGTNRHERLVLECALQSTSMPALHRRNLPSRRSMVDGGMRKCSAGACPPLGPGWGVAESAAPTGCTKSQLRFFISWCAGCRRDEQLVRK